ncbi:MAG: hypothetical protein ACI8S6_005384 [Myxococcota bacterium]|jgi:hypothetical protein
MFNIRWTALMTAVLFAGGCETARYTEAFYPEADVDRVVIQSDAGGVELSAGSRLRVERTIRAPEGALELSHRIVTEADGEEVLYLKADCRPIIPCSVDMNITIPDGVEVEVVLEQGEVWASGIGALSVELSRGSLDVDILGPLQAQIGSGDASVSLPANTSATVAVGRGDITLSIPAGLWQLAIDAAQQKVDDEIVPSQSPSVGNIQLIAPAGAVRVAPVAQLVDVG